MMLAAYIIMGVIGALIITTFAAAAGNSGAIVVERRHPRRGPELGLHSARRRLAVNQTKGAIRSDAVRLRRQLDRELRDLSGDGHG
jgi:hypothetical protein